MMDRVFEALKTRITLTGILLLVVFKLYGQSETKTDFSRHRVTVLMANAFIPAADNIGEQNNVFIVPAWGINYDYWISPAIGVGLHNDFILQQFKIETSEDHNVIERSFPVIVSGVFLFKPAKNWTLLAGAGRELEKHESFTLINAGIEYGFELPKGWEINLNLIYDNKLQAYDSWMFGVGFSKWLSTDN